MTGKLPDILYGVCSTRQVSLARQVSLTRQVLLTRQVSLNGVIDGHAAVSWGACAGCCRAWWMSFVP
jgi:hypothetical protein